MRMIIKIFITLCMGVVPFLTFGQSLSQAAQHAVDNNPDVRQQIAQRYAFNQVVKQAKADYLPVVDLNLGIGKEHTRIPGAPGILGGDAKLTRREAGITATENLFKGFNTHNEVIRTTKEATASAFAISGIANDLALNVSEQYLNVLLQQRIVKLSRENLSAHHHIFSMIQQRKLAGLARAGDIFQAKSRVALAESNVTSAKSNLEDSETQFERFVRMPPKNLRMPKLPTRAQLPNTEKAVLAIALHNHPTLKSAEADIEAAVAQHYASRFTNYPQLDLVLNANRNHNIDGVPGLDHDESVMLQLHYNLFAGGLHIAQQRETAFQVAESRSVRNRTILEIQETVSLSWTALIAEKRRAAQLYQYQVSAYNTLKAYREQYKLGKRTLLDLLDSQNEYFQAQVSYQKARFAELFARYRILNSMGSLLNYLGTGLPPAAMVAGLHPTQISVPDVHNSAAGAVMGGHHPVIPPSKEDLADNDHYVRNGHHVRGKDHASSPKVAAGAHYAQAGHAKNYAAAVKSSNKVSSTIASIATSARTANSINKVNPQYYTLQILSGRSEVAMKDFISSHKLQNKASYFATTSGGKTWYMLVYGKYPTQNAALNAIKTLPAAFKHFSPWVRSYASIQKDMDHQSA